MWLWDDRKLQNLRAINGNSKENERSYPFNRIGERDYAPDDIANNNGKSKYITRVNISNAREDKTFQNDNNFRRNPRNAENDFNVARRPIVSLCLDGDALWLREDMLKSTIIRKDHSSLGKTIYVINLFRVIVLNNDQAQ